MEKEVVLEQKDAADWAYRGEGAVNLVLAYTGSSPSFVGKVLRIQKAPRNGSSGATIPTLLSTHEQLLWRDIDGIVSSPNKEIAAQLYVLHVMSPLLGPKYVDPGPKCGFLPVSRFISERNATKRSITRFRMHQFLKLHQGQIPELSEYNPPDLFSKSKDRIYKAMNDLFTTPQNNFRVFLNGSLVFGQLGGIAHATNLVVSEAFEDALKSVIKADNGQRTKNFLQLVSDTVCESGVLDQLLEVQKLDKFDIEGAVHAYYDIISESCAVCKEVSGDEGSHMYTSLHSIPLDESLKIVKDYLIAATAKDCSLMITFTPHEEGDSESPYTKIYLEATNQIFDYKVDRA
ncbi:Inositol-pentakisphosphate 2-kinase [Morella rubra]|uniref:Inositol-pentakisphosphate 2-kinase n=1 Tax=Morella rubra TaxID=262757 RepID=A0A6A1WR18_9ROSI|nr:Inositol-pentakisphosphate 2-kinase [Morella rubra]